MNTSNGIRLMLALALSVLVTACGGADDTVYPDDQNRKRAGGGQTYDDTSGGILGSDGLKLFGSSRPEEPAGGTGIGVNAFLWRASLDTMSFMPLSSADPFGGVIITDWYSPPESPDERFKVNLYILGRDLRANGLRASVFRQVRRDGTWVDAEVDEKTATELENAILTRARQLRIASAQ